jgi:four helix bundle protein
MAEKQPVRQSLPFQRLDIYVLAKEFVRRVHNAKIRDRELCDQATRAAKSTFLRLCEGLPGDGVPMRRKYFAEANGSLHEAVAAMDLAATIGAASEADAVAVQELGSRLKSMLRALMR